MTHEPHDTAQDPRTIESAVITEIAGAIMSMVDRMLWSFAKTHASITPMDPDVYQGWCVVHSTEDGTVDLSAAEVHIGEPSQLEGDGSGERLPPFDPSVVRETPPTFGDTLSERIASGKVEVVREGVSIEEVLADIEKALKESE